MRAEVLWEGDEVRAAATLAEELTGIVVPRYRWPVIHSQLQQLGGGRGPAYGLEQLDSGDVTAISTLVAALSIPESFMFRHPGHFRILASLAADLGRRSRPCRVLCAGCSTGEEVWSAAAVLAANPAPAGTEHEVVGWEINDEWLRRAATGRYREWSRRDGLRGYERFFRACDPGFEVVDELRGMVSFENVNLVVAPLPARRPFDAVLFRNVAIYWRPSAAERVFAQLADLLAEDGALLVGPSDPVSLPGQLWEHRIEDGVRSFWRRSPARVPSTRKDFAPPTMVASASDPSASATQDRTTFAEDARAAGPAPPAGAQQQPHAVAEPPGDMDSALHQVRTLADRGSYIEALELLQGPAELPVEAKRWQGILLLNLGRSREAVALFRQCVFLQPEEAELRRWLATAYEAIGRYEDAEREHRNALELKRE